MNHTLDELDRLEKAATPGPWAVNYSCVDLFIERPEGEHGPDDYVAELRALDDRTFAERDAALIAAARNALPDLLRIARAAANYARMAPPRGHQDEPARLAEMRDALRAVGGWL